MANGPETRLEKVRRVHRHFLYLDGEEVLNSLASLSGGNVESVLETSLKVVGGNAGVKFSLFGAGFEFGGKRSRETRREVELRQTVHSAVTVLLDELYKQTGVGELTNTTDLPPTAENLVLQFEARVQLPNEWTPPTRKLQWYQGRFKSKRAREAQALAGVTNDWVVARADLSPGSDGSDVALLRLRGKYLLVDDPLDFGRRATVVGQVSMVVADHNERLVVDGNTSGQYVRAETVAAPGSPSSDRLDPDANLRVAIRPLCIFK